MISVSSRAFGVRFWPRRRSDEEYVEHVRNWQKRLKKLRVVLLICGLALPIMQWAQTEKLRHLEEEGIRYRVKLQLPHDEILVFTTGFELGRTLGVALCLGSAWLLLAITGAWREREKTLMLKFHDELRRKGDTGSSI
jgi:hypothetical protein